MALIKEYIFTREVFFNLLILLMWGQGLLTYLRGFVGMLPVINHYQMETQIVVVTVIVLLAMPAVLNKLAPLDWIYMFGWLSLYLLNMGLYVNNYDILIKKMFSTLCIVTPFFFYGRVLDIRKYLKPMTAVSAICIIMDAVYFLIYMRNPAKMAERMAGEYYMETSYLLLPHVMLMGWLTMKELSLWKFGLSLLGLLLIFAYGTRGPLACLGVFCIICFFFFTHFRHALWIKGGIIVLCGIGLMFAQPILLFMQETLSSMDMSTRIIERMLAGGLTHDTGRSFIQMRMYDLLERPGTFRGYGLFGNYAFDIVYAHKYHVDFFFHYGYMLGGLILLFTSYIIIRGLALAKGMEREFAIMLVCATIVKCQFSGTYIHESLLFALYGYCTTILIKHKYQAARQA